MADFLYNTAAAELLMGYAAGDLDPINDTIKAMLVGSGYVADRDHDVVDAAGVDDPVDHELTGTGYIAGWGGAGRKTLASKTLTLDKANDRVAFDAADVTWTGIDAGAAAQALLVKEGVANDTTSRLFGHIDSGGFPKTTNGGDLTIQWATAGIVHFKTTP